MRSDGSKVCWLWIACVVGSGEPNAAERRTYGPMSYLDNGVIRVGADLGLGGAITYVGPSGGGPEDNMVNNFDLGRQIQTSYFSGPVPFTVAGQRPAKHWEHIGWNPIQSGDDFGNGSTTIEVQNDGKSIHVRCVPLQWPLNNVPGECIFESRITLEQNRIHVTAGIDNRRIETTQFPGRHQELPAIYLKAGYHRLMSYRGVRPFADEPAEHITNEQIPQVKWSYWQGTENWAALVNDQDFGLGIWSPERLSFVGGFSGAPNQGGVFDRSTGYVASYSTEIIDHNIQHRFAYVLIVGKLDDIRGYVRDHSVRGRVPEYVFANDRQGWHYVDAKDAGWPIQQELVVDLNSRDPSLVGPAAFWSSKEAPTLFIRAAYSGRPARAQVYWKRFGDKDFSFQQQLTFDLVPDGKYRTYSVRLSTHPQYQGPMVGLRFDPQSNGQPGDVIRVRAIGFHDSFGN